MYVRYHTNSRYPNNGFKARAKIGNTPHHLYQHSKQFYQGVCGGTRYLGKSGTAVIRSPDYPGHYRKNVDCEWVVRGPPGPLHAICSFILILSVFGFFPYQSLKNWNSKNRFFNIQLTFQDFHCFFLQIFSPNKTSRNFLIKLAFLLNLFLL